MPCLSSDDGSIVVCRPGPGRIVRSGQLERKWCFACRKHLEHELVAFVEDTPSYYEPITRWDCPKCGRDCTAFPTG